MNVAGVLSLPVDAELGCLVDRASSLVLSRIDIRQRLSVWITLATQSHRQRTGGACTAGGAVSGTGLCAGAAAGRGEEAEILLRISCSEACR